jgi:hypothetical protein
MKIFMILFLYILSVALFSLIISKLYLIYCKNGPKLTPKQHIIMWVFWPFFMFLLPFYIIYCYVKEISNK